MYFVFLINFLRWQQLVVYSQILLHMWKNCAREFSFVESYNIIFITFVYSILRDITYRFPIYFLQYLYRWLILTTFLRDLWDLTFQQRFCGWYPIRHVRPVFSLLSLLSFLLSFFFLFFFLPIFLLCTMNKFPRLRSLFRINYVYFYKRKTWIIHKWIRLSDCYYP